MGSREVRIELLSEPHFNARPRAFTPREQDAFQAWFTEALTNNWIEPSTARCSSALLFVPKKDGKLRTCIDYRALNAITKSRVYAPRSDTLLRQEISRSRWYTKIDLKDAFYHMKVNLEDRWKTSFRTPQGLYQFTALPQGLKNAPGEFQLYIERLLSTVLGENVTVHIDDILIHTVLRETNVSFTHKVVTALRMHNIHINKEKSVFLTDEVEYCGFRYHAGTIKPLYQTETIDHWPLPTNTREVQAILGFANHYRDHIPAFAAIAQPLYSLTGNSWNWTNNHTNSIAQLKHALNNMIMTHTHDRTAPATITTDASLFAIAAILDQNDRPTAIISRQLTSAERNYDAAERELLAVVYAVDKWIWLIEDAPHIRVRTDNMINATNLKQSTANRRKNRWIERLMRHTLIWEHLPGEKNPADAPSRRPDYKKGGGPVE